MGVGYARAALAAISLILCACGQSADLVEPLSPAELGWRAGNAALEQRQFEQAVAQYDAAIAADPQFALAYVSRGNAYLGLSNYDAAISDYSNALAMDGALAEAFRARGELYWSIGDLTNAEQDFATLVQLRPDDSADASRYAFLLYELGRHGELEQFYRNVYSADQRRDWALLGWLTSVEQSRGVSAMQEQSLQLYNSGDQSLMVRYSLGTAYFQQQQYAAAIPHLSSLISDDPLKVPTDAFFNLATAYAATYQPQACAEAFHEYLNRMNRGDTFNHTNTLTNCTIGG